MRISVNNNKIDVIYCDQCALLFKGEIVNKFGELL